MAWKLLQKSGTRIKAALSNIYTEGDRFRVHFYEPVKSITPGQSAVFYEGEDVIGGGIIT